MAVVVVRFGLLVCSFESYVRSFVRLLANNEEKIRKHGVVDAEARPHAATAVGWFGSCALFVATCNCVPWRMAKKDTTKSVACERVRWVSCDTARCGCPTLNCPCQRPASAHQLAVWWQWDPKIRVVAKGYCVVLYCSVPSRPDAPASTVHALT